MSRRRNLQGNGRQPHVAQSIIAPIWRPALNILPSAPITLLGEIMLESSATVAALPEPDTTVVVDEVNRELGGPALNMAMHLASLGHGVRLGGVIGRSDEGALSNLIRPLGLVGGDLLSELCWVTGSSDLLFYFKTADHYSAVYQRAPIPSDLPARYEALGASGGILVMAGSRHAAVRRAFAGVSLSSNARWKIFAPNYAVDHFSADELAHILPHVNLVSLNELEAETVRSRLGLATINQLESITKASILVTRAAKGARLYQGSNTLDLPPLSGVGGDVIGAGDAFVSGLVHGLARGWEPAPAAALGSRVAGMFVRTGAKPLIGQFADLLADTEEL